VFGVGLAMTVAPLTAAILGDVDPKNAGIASAVNNAVARVAGLVAVAAIGALVAAQFGSVMDRRVTTQSANPVVIDALNKAKTRPLDISVPADLESDDNFKSALREASVSAFRSGITASAGLMVAGGLISAAGIRNPARKTKDSA
jgi:hypothetical protein